MRRNSSIISTTTSVNSTTNSLLNSSSTSSKLPSINPLVQLERFVYRLDSILALNYDSFIKDDNKIELGRQLSKLLEYQEEIERLRVNLGEISIKKEFEGENRVEWINSKVNLLRKTIQTVQDALNEDTLKNELSKQLVQEAPVQEQINSTDDNDHQLTLTTAPPPLSPKEALLDEILPTKPENMNLSTLQLPEKKKKNKQQEQESDKKSSQIQFSDSVQSDHDTLTSELISTIQLIKRNNLHLRKVVQSDDKIISEASGLLATNSDSLKREGNNLKKFSKSAWMTFWKSFLILIFLMITFLFVYIFIRIT